MIPYALLILAFPAGSEATSRPLLDCNFNFGAIAQIQIFREGEALRFRTLSYLGSWSGLQPLDEAMWARREVRFSHRGENYRFHSRDGRSWIYEVRSGTSSQPGIIGSADCG